MAFLKHVGKHGDRRVCVLFRQVPNEDHMCLVIYPDVLPAHWQDTIQKVLESEVGQQAEELANALHRSLLPDGRVILETLHQERMIKKIRCSDVIITPTATAKIRLDELNKMLSEMKLGDEAVKRMAQNDAARGMVAPEIKRAAEAEFKSGRQSQPVAQASPNSALDDRALASNMLAQAQRMESEAKGLIAEAARMKKDAERMDPGVVASIAPTTVSATTTAKKRGRPSKQAVADATQ
jgi:hypothetical protein